MNVLFRLQAFFSPPLGHYASFFFAYLFETIFMLIFATVVFVAMIYIFRKYMARLQLRIGPNRVGKFGTCSS